MAKTSINTQTQAPAGKKKSWLLIIPLILVVAGASAGGVYYFLVPHGEAAVAAAEEKAAPPPAVPVFVETKPFTVNLQDDSGRMLYIGVSLKVADEAAKAQLSEHMPEVRNRILMILTNQKADQLTTTTGKQTLASDILAGFSQPFEDGQQPLAVTDVLFTDFIVQ